ncbi:MAG: ABC transporter ATP-binding protein, partial [Gemmatimonadota bacterium]|nr:ABC transporter ATP-binding protein [Gemmatimonadota bacterium]
MIEVEGLTYSYPNGEHPAVRDLSFSIEQGEVFGFLGPSGAGKSTTQNILIGLLKGFEGNVKVMDRSLVDWGAEYFEEIGVSFEAPNHFAKLTARENLSFFGSLYEGEGEDPGSLLEMVALDGDADVRVSQFSKGMKHRLNFARSLLNRPRLWFLDEPTAGLDPINGRRVRDIVREQQGRGVTTFLTTHDMAVADELCDRVGFIVDGRVETVDTPRALKLEHGTRSLRVEFDDED